MHTEIEQLWYTWSTVGLGHTNGFQVRAASKNLQDMQNERFRSLDRHLRYSLPQGADPYTVGPAQAPVCLAFVDTGAEHILVHKTFTGRDQFGRSGNFFTHLLAGLPQNFTAQEAIQLWQWSGWQTTDTLAQYQFELPTLTPAALVAEVSQLRSNTHYVKDFLATVIQAYVTLEEQQHLYIAAPPEAIASFIQALCWCLPRRFLHALTFSTYEYDVLKASTRIIGTCWLDGDTPDGVQADLPPACYQGRHKVINCFKAKPQQLPPTTLEARFAQTASQGFITQDARYLKEFFKRMESFDPADLDMRSFLVSYSLFADEVQQKKVFAEDLDLILVNPGLAAYYLEQERIRQALLEVGVKNQAWATTSGWHALRNLSLLTADATHPALQKTLKNIVKVAAQELQRFVHQHDVTAIWYLLQLCESALPPARDTKTWSNFLEILTDGQDNLLDVYPWPLRAWVLRNFSFVRDEKRLAPWLFIQWSELDRYLALQLTPRWTQPALSLLFNGSSSIPETAIPLLEQHADLLEKLLKETLITQKLMAISYFDKLIAAGYRHKHRLLEIIIPRLTADEIATEALLVAARFSAVEANQLLETTILALLSYKQLPPTLNSYIERYLHRFNVADLRDPQSIHMLKAWQQLTLSPTAQPLLQSWLSLASFVQQPGTQEQEMALLTRTISQLPAESYPALSTFLVPFMSAYISDEHNLINVVTCLESVLQQDRRHLLHLFVRAAGEDYDRLRSTKHLSIFSSVILDLAELDSTQNDENYQHTSYSKQLLQALLHYADKNTFQDLNALTERWSEEKQAQWYSLTRSLQDAKKVKVRRNTQANLPARLNSKRTPATDEDQSLLQKLLQRIRQHRSD